VQGSKFKIPIPLKKQKQKQKQNQAGCGGHAYNLSFVGAASQRILV
jgi:hypothetical protein